MNKDTIQSIYEDIADDPVMAAVVGARVLLGLIVLAAVVCMWVFAPFAVSVIVTGIFAVFGLAALASLPL